MKKLIIPAIFSVTMLTSCEKKNSETVDHSTHGTTEQVADEDHSQHETEAAAEESHADTSATLELDNGKKWKTNAEMLPFVNKQEELLNGFEASKDDYRLLAENLQKENDQLVQSCTMKGKSHDVLHVWLVDHLKKVDLLKKTETAEEAVAVTNELKKSMDTYHHYFE